MKSILEFEDLNTASGTRLVARGHRHEGTAIVWIRGHRMGVPTAGDVLDSMRSARVDHAQYRATWIAHHREHKVTSSGVETDFVGAADLMESPQDLARNGIEQ